MVHYFHSDIAQKYGINAAVLAGFIWDCIEEKSTRQPQLHEGKAWSPFGADVDRLFSVSLP